MELYVARQPIFDRRKSIIGYELLHRECMNKNEYSATNGEYASSNVISSAFLTIGLDSLTNNKLAFINFTEDLIKNGVAQLFPKEQLVIEILESVAPTKEILRACEQLKGRGYKLVLDDYVLDPVYEPLACLADIIKIDVRRASYAEQYRVISKHAYQGIQFLAEKVETEDEFHNAEGLGYSLFQGYFFSKPIIMTANTMLAGKLGYIRLMQAVNSINPDFNMIISAIESDVKLSMETIKLSNSAYYGRRMKISSIRQAVVALGLEGVRKWIYLSSLRRLGTGKPDVLISTSIIRSKFMELLASQMGQALKSPEYSMLGLFSMLDVLTNTTFEKLFESLNIAEDIKEVLLGNNLDTNLGIANWIMLTYERGNWEDASAYALKIGLTLDDIAGSYITSLKWYNEFISISDG